MIFEPVELPLETIEVPILGTTDAALPMEMLPVLGYRTIRALECVDPKEVAAIRLVGDALQADGYWDDDWLIVRRACQAEEGDLIIALTPHGLRPRYYHKDENGNVLLKGARPEYDEVWKSEEVFVEAIVLRMERDLYCVGG